MKRQLHARIRSTGMGVGGWCTSPVTALPVDLASELLDDRDVTHQAPPLIAAGTPHSPSAVQVELQQISTHQRCVTSTGYVLQGMRRTSSTTCM